MSANRGIIAIALLLSFGMAPGNPGMAQEPISLAGTWQFRRDDTKVGLSQEWFRSAWTRADRGPSRIALPGTMDLARAGDANTRPATLDGPYRVNVYTGPAWYQREIEIPESWREHQVQLCLERVRWVSRAWLDEQSLDEPQDSLCTPHVFDLGFVKPGKHRLTLCVDNSLKHNLGIFVSALFGGTHTDMNGIVGRIELRPHAPVWIESQQVYPQLDGQVKVAVEVRNELSDPVAGTVTARVIDPTDGAVVGEGRTSFSYGRGIRPDGSHIFTTRARESIAFKLTKPPRLWDEFQPNLYRLELRLETSGTRSHVSTAETTFGFRTIGVRGKQITLNNRPIYLRGTLECAVFPVTGHPPMDVEAWQRICRIIKSYGLNHLRFHSWTPPDAAFTAADREGILIQTEGPQANVPAGQDPARDAFIEQEFLRIVRTYGNHPSFCLMTLGNEYGGKAELLTKWVDMLIREDPRRLFSSASAAQRTDNRQFTVTPLRGIKGPGTDHDFRAALAREDRPVISHEIGQWMFFPNFAEMSRYTGVFRAKNFELIQEGLTARGLIDLAPLYYETWGKQAVLLYKEEMEVLRRTPEHAGFQLLDLHDYPTQGTAIVGPLDPFWESKGFVTPEVHRQYCGPTALLLRMPKRTFTAPESVRAEASVSHFGPADLPQGQPIWSLLDARGQECRAGRLPAQPIPTGQLSALGAFEIPLADLAAPGKYTVRLALEGTPFQNSWDIWIYPPAVRLEPPVGVTLNTWWEAARQALADGKTVAFFPDALKFDRNHAFPGRFLPVFWSPVWFPHQIPNTMGILCDPKHPALARFPTENHSNWQWHDLHQNSVSMVLNETPREFRPIVQVMDNFARNDKLGAVFEARVGPGKLLVSTIDLVHRLDERPVARQLRASLLAYAASPDFQPACALDVAFLDRLFAPPSSRLARLGARVHFVDSEDRDHQHLAAHAFDGDPSTYWHTRWNPDAPQPHTLVIDLRRDETFAGFTYLPRQDQHNGRVAVMEIFISPDGTTWKEPILTKRFKDSAQLETLRLPSPVTARFVKIVTRSEVRGQPFAAIAEFDLLPAPR